MSTIGCDPEVFLVDTSGEYIPSIGLVGGTKKSPLKVVGGFVQEDNVTAEFNIPPIDLDAPEDFVAAVQLVMKSLEDKVSKKNLKLSLRSSARFQPHFLQNEAAIESGCDPDLNVYSGKRNVYPSLFYTDMRSCGGHIHFGDKDIFQEPGSREAFIKLCDYHIGLPLNAISWDKERTQTYGKAGNYRYKPYGVEYRTPSNIWLHTAELMYFVCEGIRKAKSDLITNNIRNINIVNALAVDTITSGDFSQYLSLLPAIDRKFITHIRKTVC